MIETLFYIDNKQVNAPQNAAQLQAQLNYGKDQFPSAGTISITDFIWVGAEYKLLKGYIDAGLTGGIGITEGPSMRITATDGKITQTVFEGFFDFTSVKIKDRISITTKVINFATIDWLQTIAQTFTFEYLASPDFQATGLPGFIDPSFYRWMPYCLNTIPNYEQAAIATLSIFSITNILYQQIEEISDIIADIAGFFNTPAGIVKFIVKVAYIIVLLVSLIKLIEDIIKFLISPVKYHAGMYASDLLERGATYLNMKFVSDIWESGSPYENEFIIPQKLFNAPSAADNSILGFLVPDPNEQVGWYKGTYGDLLEAMKIKYNAKVIVTLPPGGATPTNQGTITLIRRDKNALPPQYTLPNTYKATSEYTFNNDELPANYEIMFQTDTQDMNTLQNYQGTLFQVICTQQRMNYQPFVRIKGLQQEVIPFARVSTKTGLTVPEQIIEDFLQVFDVIDSALVAIANTIGSIANIYIKFYNGILKALSFIGINIKYRIPTIPTLSKTNLTSTIDNRVGMMMLSYDHFTVPKILLITEGSQPKFNKVSPVNDVFESAIAMWEGYHYVNSMLPAIVQPLYADRPFGNQYKIQQFNGIPFTWNDFLKVVNNNRVLAPDGVTPAIVESLKFYPPMEQGSSGKADIKARISYIWTLNLQETFLNPDGR